MNTQNGLIELYKNQKGCVYQDDRKNCLVIEFNGTTVSLNLPCFLCLKKSVDKLRLEDMVNNLKADVEIITACGCDRCYVVTLCDAVALKDLLTGAKTMLELNRILRERIYSYSFYDSKISISA